MSCLVLFIYLKSNTILLMFNHVRGSFVRLEATWNIMCLGFLYNGSNFQGWGFNPKYQKHKNEMYKWNVKLDFLKIYWVPENWYSYFNGFSESCYTATTTTITEKTTKRTTNRIKCFENSSLILSLWHDVSLLLASFDTFSGYHCPCILIL